VAIDTSNYYLSWVDTQPVKFRSKGAHPRTINVAVAKNSALTARDQANLGMQFSPKVISWSLPVALMDGVVPASGDEIVEEDGTRWVLNSLVEYLGNGSRWRVVATREV